MNFVGSVHAIAATCASNSIECNTSPRSGGHLGPRENLEGFQVVADAIWAIFLTLKDYVVA